MFISLIGAVLFMSLAHADNSEVYRLAGGVEPTFQQITLSVDPDQADYTGTTSITLSVKDGVDRIEFYQSNLELKSVRLKSGNEIRILTASVE